MLKYTNKCTVQYLQGKVTTNVNPLVKRNGESTKDNHWFRFVFGVWIMINMAKKVR